MKKIIIIGLGSHAKVVADEISRYKEYKILQNVKDRSKQLIQGLEGIRNLKNLRNAGLLVAFDLDSEILRDKFVNELYKNNKIVNPTKDKTVRLRPPLSVSSKEISLAINIISSSLLKSL